MIEVFWKVAQEDAMNWANRAAWHRSRGEERLATYAEQMASTARRYAEIAQEQLQVNS